MPLRLRKITSHPHATDAYRVIFVPDDGAPELAVGSIGLQIGAGQRRYWRWGIYTVLPRQAFKTNGEARDRDDAMAQFKAVWEVFASEPDRLAAFIATLRTAAQ